MIRCHLVDPFHIFEGREREGSCFWVWRCEEMRGVCCVTSKDQADTQAQTKMSGEGQGSGERLHEGHTMRAEMIFDVSSERFF